MADPFPAELRARLDAEPVRPIVEYPARRLDCDHGSYRVAFLLENGSLRQTDLGRSPIRNAELEAIGTREAPPLLG